MDCRALASDLLSAGDTIVSLLEAFAGYIKSEVGVDIFDFANLTSDNLRDAAFSLEVKARQLAQFEHEACADPRGYDKAQRQGVD